MTIANQTALQVLAFALLANERRNTNIAIFLLLMSGLIPHMKAAEWNTTNCHGFKTGNLLWEDSSSKILAFLGFFLILRDHCVSLYINTSESLSEIKERFPRSLIIYTRFCQNHKVTRLGGHRILLYLWSTLDNIRMVLGHSKVFRFGHMFFLLHLGPLVIPKQTDIILTQDIALYERCPSGVLPLVAVWYFRSKLISG